MHRMACAVAAGLGRFRGEVSIMPTTGGVRVEFKKPLTWPREGRCATRPGAGVASLEETKPEAIFRPILAAAVAGTC
jgi:hypothetical protein